LEDASPFLVALAFVRCPGSGVSSTLFRTAGPEFENESGNWELLLLFFFVWAVLFFDGDGGGDGDGDGDVGGIAEIRMRAIMWFNSPSSVALAFFDGDVSGCRLLDATDGVRKEGVALAALVL